MVSRAPRCNYPEWMNPYGVARIPGQKEGMAAFVEKRKPTWKGR